MKKIRFTNQKGGFYGCNYPQNSVVEVDDNFASYAIGMGDAAEAKPDEKVTDPIPYIMAPRKSENESAMNMIAEALAHLAGARKPVETVGVKK